jgi:hypothetical protein
MANLKKKGNFKQDIRRRFELTNQDDLNLLDELIGLLYSEPREINRKVQESVYYADYAKDGKSFQEFQNDMRKALTNHRQKETSDSSKDDISDIKTNVTSDKTKNAAYKPKGNDTMNIIRNDTSKNKKQSKYAHYTLTRVEPSLYNEVSKAADDHDQKLIPFLNAIIEIGLKNANEMDIVQTIVTQRRKVSEGLSRRSRPIIKDEI